MMHSEHGELVARVQTTPWKIAALYALLDGRVIVQPDDLATGWAVTRYLADCVCRLGSQIGSTDKARVLQAIEDAVRKGPIKTPGRRFESVNAHHEEPGHVRVSGSSDFSGG